MKFLHTADWQLGARFTRFGESAEALRGVRVETLRHTLERAREEAADAFLIAGDLFEDNQVDDVLVREVFRLFGEFSDVPVFILPGNHDPVSGPGCIWMRAPFMDPPGHVTLLLEDRAYRCGPGWLLAAPVKQKRSIHDPTRKLDAIAAGLTDSGPRIGVAHGSPAIEAKHQPDDHPIDLNAATRGGLDYLALGHWHGWQVFDGGRMLMPGTPEPDGFDSAGAGRAALVEIGAAGEIPKVTPIETATLRWVGKEIDLFEREAVSAALEDLLAGPEENVRRTVLRVCLRGTPANEVREAARAWLETKRTAFFATVIDDRTLPALSEGEREALRRERPLVAQVLADLDNVAALSSGRPADPPDGEDGVPAITIKDLEALCEERRIDWREFDDAFFRTARELLYTELREVTS